MAGMPAKLIGIVYISDKYIVKGSATFSFSLKAGVGDVGVIRISYFSNALSKSSLIRVRTF